MKKISVLEALKNTPVISEAIKVNGWLRTRRDSKEFSFLEINDGSCLSSLQVIASSDLVNYESDVLSANTGASFEITGTLIPSQGKGQKWELKAETVKLLGNADAESYPLQKKRHTNEFLRTIAHLRPRTNTFGAVFRLRSALSFAVHQFFKERGFVYAHTPIISTSDCEGAGELFTVTNLNLEQLAKSGKAVDFSQDFFGAKASLAVSGQLEAELLACALSKVYTFGPTFRAENSNTPRHLAEFWMIEPEVAFNDLSANADLAEDFLKYVLKYALENCAEDLEFFNTWVEKGILDSLGKLADSAFERLSYTDAIKALEKSGRKFEFPVSWGLDLQTEHEKYLTEEYLGKPVFIMDYPKEIKAFYMRLNDDNKTVAAMDLLVPRLGEIIGGSQREEREDVLKARIKECGLPEENYWWYLETRKYGSVPHAGFGLGFERLVMYISGIANIRDSIPFPRTPGNANF